MCTSSVAEERAEEAQWRNRYSLDEALTLPVRICARLHVVHGTMLWFNSDKGYGFIQTEHAERLYVARSGFQLDQEPQRRCKGRDVSFDRIVAEGDIRAVNVEFVEPTPQRRARMRHSRG